MAASSSSTRYNAAMDWKAVLQNPSFTVALPIIITLITGILVQNKRFDELGKRMDDQGNRIDDLRTDMNRQFDGVNRRLDKIESKLESHSERIAKLEGPALVRST